ncbi:pentapeptide repeat-containing protein [Microseira sp. BLCC-F43]|jgi:uncharacterized protein YjbI with pentapeptide repeats|uniref:pentapeptide repeat-containing protein n=1 Tax=Microseira sp. BLCC-F43 TaxID=3153602 RepID=UPI0035B90535
MSNYTDFSSHGYQVKRELGQNRACGRVTYLATNKKTNSPVVIKQFQFAQTGASWSDYDAYDKEVQLLQRLDHPSIPRYLDSFETPSGFCLVQEYKYAPSLAQPHLLTLTEIKQIAVAVLEVLVYLQRQQPVVIHRDIKPENILVNWQDPIKIYLVDFGFARIGGGDVAVSSAIKGTLGFMPPEQLFNRQLTEASDLYSLGVMLVGLLTNTKSTEIGKLIDDAYQINFKLLVPKVNPQFLEWLETMVTLNLKNRFSNAAAALEALQPIEVVGKVKIPEISEHAIKRKQRVRIAGLVGFSIVAGGIATINYRMSHQASIRHLLETNKCPKCDLTGADLKQTNLKNANLWGAKLTGANLEGADLTGAKLGYAKLVNTNLASAKLGNADLRGAIIANAELVNADLAGAKLGYANLGRANLTGTNLTAANLWNAYLGDANLQNAKIGDADLRRANLKDANLENTNLKRANLGGAELGYANLGSADLSDAILWDANLASANLASANLGNADLRSAILRDANLTEANLSSVNLERAYLGEAKLIKANLTAGNLSEANLTEANLTSAILTRANLAGADLERAKLEGAILFRANLSNADLKAANLKSVNLWNANLQGAYLKSANLTNANLINANLKSANLTDANLTNVTIKRFPAKN